MLSRTASSLYWLGRYVERTDFIARLVEATVRLDTPNEIRYLLNGGILQTVLRDLNSR